MHGESIAQTIGVIIGAFIFVTIVSRLVWYFATKLGGERVGMVAALAVMLLILVLHLTSSTRRLDAVYEIALAVAMLMYLLLDIGIILVHGRNEK